MNKIIILLLIITSLHSCKKEKESRPTSSSTTIRITDYYPLKVGNEWKYRGIGKYVFLDSMQFPDTSYYDTVKITRKIVDVVGDTFFMITYWPEGYDVSIQEDSVITKIIASKDTIGEIENSIYFSTGGILIASNPWMNMECTTPQTTCPSGGAYHYSYSENNPQTIVNDTLRVDRDFYCQWADGPDPPPPSFLQSDTRTFVKNIGPLEYYECRVFSDQAYGTKFVLYDYTIN